jgi:UDP-N-acetylglucosamine 2-epimerase (non-hydrolysing)
LSYIDFLSLVKGSELVLTDSGGVQEETTYLNIRCLTLRDDTERPITVDLGTNTLVGSNSETIISEINSHLEGSINKSQKIDKWDGKTSERIVEVLFGR